MNVMVVPARGGMGGALETQANTLACEIARRLGGHHRMMHLPDHLDEQALQEMRKLTRLTRRWRFWSARTWCCMASAARTT